MLRRHTICFGKPKSECEELIEEWVFNSRDKEVVKQRFLEGHTYETHEADNYDMAAITEEQNKRSRTYRKEVIKRLKIN